MLPQNLDVTPGAALPAPNGSTKEGRKRPEHQQHQRQADQSERALRKGDSEDEHKSRRENNCADQEEAAVGGIVVASQLQGLPLQVRRESGDRRRIVAPNVLAMSCKARLVMLALS